MGRVRRAARSGRGGAVGAALAALLGCRTPSPGDGAAGGDLGPPSHSAAPPTETGAAPRSPGGDHSAAPAAPPLVVTNPVLAGDHPDPHVLRTVEGDGTARYWLTHTVGSGADLPVYTSTDLATWTLATPGLFGVPSNPGGSIALNGRHYCHLWAPELTELGPGSYQLSFTATRYDAPQSVCPPYGEDGGVYLAWSASPTGPFADAAHPWEPLPAGGQISTCGIREQLPRSVDVAAPDCQGTFCHHLVRLDSTVWRDPADGRWWLGYAWYTNTPPMVAWERANAGEHVSLVQLDAADPFAVVCDPAVPQVHVGNPHDAAALSALAASCPGCDQMLSNTRGRLDEEMVRDGVSWGVTEGPSLLRRGGWVYAFLSGSAWDSAYYHVWFVAAPTVEGLSWEGDQRLVGRLLVPSDAQSFGHGSVVLGPDGETLFYVHHRLRHDACRDGWDCARDVWVTPLAFEDRGDGRGEIWPVVRWPAREPVVEIPR